MELGDDARTGVHITPDEYIPRTLQTDKKFSGNKPDVYKRQVSIFSG